MQIKRYTQYFKPTIKIALPIVVAQAGGQITSMADMIMVGNVSSLHLAAASVANYIFLVPFLFGIGLAGAITPLVGEANGENNLAKCHSLFANSIYYQLVNTTVITVIIFLFGLAIPHLRLDDATVKLATPYYNWLMLSFIPFMMFFILKQYLDGFGLTVYGMIATISGNVINIFLNWILIYGKWGFPALELNGAGIATCISRVLSLVIILAIMFGITKLKDKWVMPKIKFFFINDIRKLYKIGVNIGIQLSTEMSSFSVLIILAGWLGTTALASYQIMMSISGLAYLSMTGIGGAATVLISTYSGEKNIRKIVDGSFSIILLMLIFVVISASVLILTRNILPEIYVNDAAVLATVPTLLLMAAIYQLPDGMLIAFVGIMRGLFDVKVPAIIQTISYWGIMLPLAYFFAFTLNLNITGIALSIIIGISLCYIIMFFRYRSTLSKQLYRLSRK